MRAPRRAAPASTWCSSCPRPPTTTARLPSPAWSRAPCLGAGASVELRRRSSGSVPLARRRRGPTCHGPARSSTCSDTAPRRSTSAGPSRPLAARHPAVVAEPHPGPHAVGRATGVPRSWLKALAREAPDTELRALELDPTDVPSDPDGVAARIVAELADEDGPVEVRAAASAPVGAEVEIRPGPTGRSLATGPDDGAVVLLTGGARGITARAAVAIAAASAPRRAGRVARPGRAPRTPDHRRRRRRDRPAPRPHRGRRAQPAEPLEAAVRRILADREIRATLDALAAPSAPRAAYHSPTCATPTAVRAVVDDVVRPPRPPRRRRPRRRRLRGRPARGQDARVASPGCSRPRWTGAARAGSATLAAPSDCGSSSCSAACRGVYGNRGQADYAAANDALDTLARVWRHRLGGAGCVSVDWGPWSPPAAAWCRPSSSASTPGGARPRSTPTKGVAALLAELAGRRRRAPPRSCTRTVLGLERRRCGDSRPTDRRRHRRAWAPSSRRAPTSTTFWRNVCDGVDAITDVPAVPVGPRALLRPRRRSTAPASDRFYCRRGGFVDDLADFDPAAFGVMPVAVDGAEPDQLLALRTGRRRPSPTPAASTDLPDRSRIGVIIGRGGYLTPGLRPARPAGAHRHQLRRRAPRARPRRRRRPARRGARRLRRPARPDRPESRRSAWCPTWPPPGSPTASTSGARPTPSTRPAPRSLRRRRPRGAASCAPGRCDAVLAGGVHHCHDVTLWSVFTQLGALSPSQAHPARSTGDADGILIGEGTGDRRPQAPGRRRARRRPGLRRHPGHGRGQRRPGAEPDEPRRRAARCWPCERAWRRRRPRPARRVGLLEAHGTATPTGDQVELETLRPGLRPGRRRPSAGRSLGSVKSMIGHAMPAAGVAGLIKAALAVHHGVLPPTLHVRGAPPGAGRAPGSGRSPRLEPWDARRRRPRRAGGRTPSASAASTPTWCWRRRPDGAPPARRRPPNR